MPITLVNRENAELTFYIGEDKQKLVFDAGERKDDIDGSKCLDIKDHPFVQEGWIEVFGNPEDDVKVDEVKVDEDKKETLSQKRAREKLEAEKNAASNKNSTAK